MSAHGEPDEALRGARDALRGSPELDDWLESLDEARRLFGPEWVAQLLRQLQLQAAARGVPVGALARTPYVNTIPPEREPPYPGDPELEQRIEDLVRWNAAAMVVRANRRVPGLGGHLSTFASIATLYEVGFHHAFRGRDHESGGDLVYFQGHASPGNYARAFLEGRLDEARLDRFRQETGDAPGLSSYPHPWLMPDFWEFPTVSMGLGPILAIYQARFRRYLEHRGLVAPSDARVWCFLGDGECDEPEALGALALAAYEELDNLIFVVDGNLQRLDGPVRGNHKILQELEARFRGAGWHVIQVLWSSDWDPLFERDVEGRIAARLEDVVDGDLQRYRARGGAELRRHLFGASAELAALVQDLTDDELTALRTGGHDRLKVWAAYHQAMRHRGAPTVVLAQTVKGHALGGAAEALNVSHQAKKLGADELRALRDRLGLGDLVGDEEVEDAPYARPPEDSPERRYLLDRRAELGGFLPERRTVASGIEAYDESAYDELLAGTEGREATTTMALVRLLSKLLRDRELGPRIVPIVPDEARTFGMETLFRQCGIYSPRGQRYDPVDRENVLYYREARDGQLLEEGITEAGSMASFVAAGTSHATHGVAMLPFYFFYSMFGFQRVGDLIWAAGDSRARGFLVGATAGRTTLAGEGLQHQDGQSHLMALSVPNLRAYDPAHAYELAVIVQDGVRRMFLEGEDVFYYLTVENEGYAQPALPDGAREGILRGAYRARAAGGDARAHLLGSGAMLREALAAQELLAERFGVDADVWSVTSYGLLERECAAARRQALLSPGEPPARTHLADCFGERRDVFVAATDYLRALPASIASFLPGPLTSLGTDGFGRSAGREALRAFFEVDRRWIALAALAGLAREGHLDPRVARDAVRALDIDPEKADPLRV